MANPNNRSIFIGSGGFRFRDQNLADLFFTEQIPVVAPGPGGNNILQGWTPQGNNYASNLRIMFACIGWGFSILFIEECPAYQQPWGYHQAFTLQDIAVTDSGHAPQIHARAAVRAALDNTQPVPDATGRYGFNGFNRIGHRLPWNHKVTVRRTDGHPIHYQQCQLRDDHGSTTPALTWPNGKHYSGRRVTYGALTSSYRQLIPRA